MTQRLIRSALTAVRAELPASMQAAYVTLQYVLTLLVLLAAPYVGHGIRTLFT